MTGYSHNDPIRRPADHSWVLAVWVLPLVLAIGFTIITAGFGAIAIPFVIVIGLVASVLHRSGGNR